MEFRDLMTQYLRNKAEIDSAIQNVIYSSHFIGGASVKQLEESLADCVGVKHCITCANGTDALQLALMAWEIGEGDAVFVPDFTFFATAEVVPWMKATPIFVDVEKDTYNISAQSLEEAIKEIIKEGKLIPKAVIAVDLFGQPADFPAVRAIARNYNLLLLEDGAQGFGGRIEGGKEACSFGDISTTSFFPAKPLGCYGDGGAIFTDNDEWAELIRSFCVHGKGSNKYDNVRIGLNSRLDALQASILQAKLKTFCNYELDKVNEVAGWYSDGLKEMDRVLNVPKILAGYYSSWAQYTIALSDYDARNKLQSYLKEYDIPSMVYYAKPIHKQIAFREYANNYMQNNERLTNTEWLCERVLSLPIYPYMHKEDVKLVCDKIKSFWE